MIMLVGVNIVGTPVGAAEGRPDAPCVGTSAVGSAVGANGKQKSQSHEQVHTGMLLAGAVITFEAIVTLLIISLACILDKKQPHSMVATVFQGGILFTTNTSTCFVNNQFHESEIPSLELVIFRGRVFCSIRKEGYT
jgi:hypothetical protein